VNPESLRIGLTSYQQITKAAVAGPIVRSVEESERCRAEWLAENNFPGGKRQFPTFGGTGLLYETVGIG